MKKPLAILMITIIMLTTLALATDNVNGIGNYTIGNSTLQSGDNKFTLSVKNEIQKNNTNVNDTVQDINYTSNYTMNTENISGDNESTLSGLTYPTTEQLSAFTLSDTTDNLNLPDDQATVQLATNAVNAGYHSQILLIVFDNGQLFAINRFQLQDNSFVYIDCSKLNGIETVTTTSCLDRVLTVVTGQPITAKSQCNQTLNFKYPNANVSYAIPLWKV